MTSIVWALHNKMPGEIWESDEIQKVADQIHAYGFDMDVVESVNVHDDKIRRLSCDLLRHMVKIFNGTAGIPLLLQSRTQLLPDFHFILYN